MINKFKWIPYPSIEKADILNNPYCGLYSIYRFYADNKYDINLISNHQICLLEINLINFNDRPLSMEALGNIEWIFRYFTLHKKQMIVRFLYDWEGKGLDSEPKNIGIVLNHMEQLSDLLKEFEDSIYIIQGLFIGSWGEMHSSRYLSEEHMTRLAYKLYDCTGEGTQIALRCPSFWRMIFKTNQPLDDKTVYSKLIRSRFSLFNDGILSSYTDYGTYGYIRAKVSDNYSDKWIRKDELNFQNKLCRYVSNGGEVINNCKYNDVETAVRELRIMRVSYLNDGYDREVLDKWKASKSPSSKPIWKDKSAFDYIAAHLGYRYLIKDIKVSPPLKGGIKIKIKLCNTGFSSSYHRFDLKLALAAIINTNFYEYHINTDTRFWLPNETVEFETFIRLDALKDKHYILCLAIYDPRIGKYIKLANSFSPGSYKGYYKLGEIKLANII